MRRRSARKIDAALSSEFILASDNMSILYKAIGKSHVKIYLKRKKKEHLSEEKGDKIMRTARGGGRLRKGMGRIARTYWVTEIYI